MKPPVAVAVAWTVLLLIFLVFAGGRVAPCPELSAVGLPGTDREAIARMCEERDRPTRDIIRANEPWSWLVIWGLGISVASVLAARSRRSILTK